LRLCFGTYANILLRCGVETLKKGRLVNTLLKSVDETCKPSASAVTWYLQCTANLPGERSNSTSVVISKAYDVDPDKVTSYFENKVIPLTDTNKRKLAVLAIREIIMNDDNINGDTVIDKVSGTTKNALQKQSKFELSKFLAGIFLFVTQLDNRYGKETVEFIDENFINSFAEEQNSIAFLKQCDEDASTSSIAFDEYLYNAKDKYSTTKTFLYNDRPKPFYDFYVPNNISHSLGVTRENIITDVTAKNLTGLSNFLIIDGDGGVGKSMMMKHLLMNAIAEYDDFCHIPIFLPLKNYNSFKNLTEFIYETLKNLNKAITKKMFTAKLNGGHFLLLFDGMDEINGEPSQRFESEIETFADRYPKNFFIISSRPFQSFVSFSRFTVVKIMPFTHQQAIKLVERLEYRPDEPGFKESFLILLKKSLYDTHRSFVENPLLLTIMLLTYEKYAKIPTKMHEFYRRAFDALSEKHDASKTGYMRLYKSKMFPEAIAKYFAEFCFRTYGDSKFELTKEEFARYFNDVQESRNTNVRPSDFAYDLCVNLCLMYFEGKYHFTHRSFQEYFCALFFAEQSNEILGLAGEFFEKRRTKGENVFTMLYDMIPDKVKAHIFVPYLQSLFERCDREDGYWTFLKEIHPTIEYVHGEPPNFPNNPPASFLYNFILSKLDEPKYTLFWDDLPHVDEFVRKEYGSIEIGNNCTQFIDLDGLNDEEYSWVEERPDTEAWTYEFDVEDLYAYRYSHMKFCEILEDDGFIFKCEYNAMRNYLHELQDTIKERDSSLARILRSIPRED